MFQKKLPTAPKPIWLAGEMNLNMMSFTGTHQTQLNMTSLTFRYTKTLATTSLGESPSNAAKRVCGV